MAKRICIIEDEYPDWSYLEQTDEQGKPLFGDDMTPEKMVSLILLAQEQCLCCGHWRDTGESLGGVDFLEDDAYVLDLNWGSHTYVTEEELNSWLNGSDETKQYVADSALDVLSWNREEAQ